MFPSCTQMMSTNWGPVHPYPFLFQNGDFVSSLLKNISVHKCLLLNRFCTSTPKRSSDWNRFHLWFVLLVDAHLCSTDTQSWSLPFFTPFIWLSVRRTPLFSGHLELVPAFLYSLYFTLYKTDTSVQRTCRAGPSLSLLALFHSLIRRTPLLNGHLELVPAFLYSLYFTLYKTDTSVQRTCRAGPSLSLLALFHSL